MSLFNTAVNSHAFLDNQADQIFWHSWYIGRDFDIYGKDLLDDPWKNLEKLDKTEANAINILKIVTQTLGTGKQTVPDGQLQNDLTSLKWSLDKIAHKVNDRIRALNTATKPEGDYFTSIVEKMKESYKKMRSLSKQMGEIATIVEERLKVVDGHSIRKKLDLLHPKMDDEKRSLLRKRIGCTSIVE